MKNDVIYVMVAVYGVEDETAAGRAIQNLTNSEQVFEPIESVGVELNEQFNREPTIHFQ